ncbi:MAG: sigma-70 family RNA polymerase sigma factor [Phycisphaerales bacterium]|nr:sigma-70 family RNA polymerase sigma factor [Phycisphaerales bacterium]
MDQPPAPPPSPDDRELALVRRAVAGDEDALVALLEEHGGVVRGRITATFPRQWQSLLSVDDVLQQAYSDAFMGIRRFEPHGTGAFLAWLSRLAKNAMLDAIAMLEAAKRGGGRQRINPGPERSLETLLGAVTNTGNSPSGVVSRAEALAALTAAIERLPATHRAVITNYDLLCQPIEEVASSLGKTVGATYMLRARAHRMLAETMGTRSMFLG